ncbi:MAG: DUF3466 family protein [Pseudomonadota bacterium]|nr:DUF3466 family protein [Pseudomonadota bacterium]
MTTSIRAQCHAKAGTHFFSFRGCHWALALTLGMSAGLHAPAVQAQARGYSGVEYARLHNPGATAVVRRINSASEVAGGFKIDARRASQALVFLPTGTESVATDQDAGHSVAFGLNDQGEVVGSYNTQVALRPFRAVRRAGFEPLALASGSNSGIAYAINIRGEAAGYVSGTAGVQPVWWSRSGAVQLLPRIGSQAARALGLNDNGDIVGVSGDERKTAVLWPGKASIVNLGTLAGFTHSEAVSISENGTIVGVATGVGEFPSRSRAVLWDAAGARAIQDLGVLAGGTDSRARDINARGEVVGTSSSSNGDRGFIWTRAGGMQDLNTLANIPGLVITDALSVNRTGDIVVVGHDAHAGAAHEHDDHEEPLRVVVLHPTPQP